jgi:DnaK suppressor protein
MISDQDKVAYRIKLLKRKRELLTTIAETDTAMSFLGESRPAEFLENAQVESAAFNLKMIVEQVRQELESIECALTRLKSDTYGVCQVCGKVISPVRLAVVPEASHCLSCEESRSSSQYS